jgi:hypothetical protein
MLVLDAGAFAAVERGDRGVVALVKRERLAGRVPEQPIRTQADMRGRVRTVTCTDTRGWTCCRQMAGRGQGSSPLPGWLHDQQ